MWDVLPRPLRARAEPTRTPVTPVSPLSTADTTIGALNVYDSSLGDIKANLTPGSVVKARLLEGFSGEEGGVDMFGTTEFDGQSRYGEVPVQADGSFAAVVPGNVPFHIQLIDKFGLSIANESIWISGRAGEQRFCGGCHESRTKAATLAPGIPTNVLTGAINLATPRAQRVAATGYVLAGGNLTSVGIAPGDNGVRGVPWDMAIQPILDAKCASCHNGTAGAANPSYTIRDNVTMMAQTFVFDLRGQKVNVMIGERATGDFTASYLSLMGLGEILSDADVTYIPAPPKQYVDAGLGEGQPGREDDEPGAALPGQHHGARLRGPQLDQRSHQPRRRQGLSRAHGGRALPPDPQHRHGWSVLLPGEPEHRWLGDPVTEKTTCTRTRQ